jgi:CheY-like chemotaxis protein
MNNEQHLLIDDVRDFGDMKTCRNYHEGVLALQERQWDVLWLDYDMGIGCYNGMDVLEWLENNPAHHPKEINMVSLSPDARKTMQDKWNSIREKQ